MSNLTFFKKKSLNSLHLFESSSNESVGWLWRRRVVKEEKWSSVAQSMFLHVGRHVGWFQPHVGTDGKWGQSHDCLRRVGIGSGVHVHGLVMLLFGAMDQLCWFLLFFHGYGKHLREKKGLFALNLRWVLGR